MISFLISVVVGFATLYLGVFIAEAVERQNLQECREPAKRRA